MSTFDITENPTKIYLGEQPQVTLVNDGPYSVYLDGIPGVNNFNGFELPPTGQMTWKPTRELWACTRSIVGQENRTKLRTSPIGELSLTTRAKFFSRIFSQSFNGQALSTPYIETGHCNSLLVTRDNIGATSGIEALTVNWYDENLGLISQELYSVQQFPTSGFTSIKAPGFSTSGWRGVIPVKGKYCRMSSVNSAPSTFAVVGSDAILPAKLDGGAGVSGGGACGGPLAYDGRVLRFPGWNGVGLLNIPNNGNDTYFYIINTNSGDLQWKDADSGIVLAYEVKPAGLLKMKFPINISVQVENATAFTSGSVTVYWPEDTVTS